MKKVILVGTFFLMAFGLSAQGFYIDFNVGYGLGFPGEVLGQESHTKTVDGEETTTTKNIKGTIGQGLHLQLTPGYMFSEYIGIELGVNYFLGSNVTVSKSDEMLTATAAGINNAKFGNTEVKVKSNQFRIIPSLIISTGMSNKFSGYAKAGLVLPVGGSTVITSKSVDADLEGSVIEKDKIVREMETKGAFSLGFRGAIGLNYKLSDNLSVFGEIFAIALNIKSKHRTITTASVNGVNSVGLMTTYQKETNYVKELNSSSNNVSYNKNINLGQARDDLSSKTSFNQTGIEIGIKYTF